MSSKESTTRLILYVFGAMLSSASAGLVSVDFDDSKAVVGFILSIMLAGVITARSYIDKSPSEVTQPEKDDEEIRHEP